MKEDAPEKKQSHEISEQKRDKGDTKNLLKFSGIEIKAYVWSIKGLVDCLNMAVDDYNRKKASTIQLTQFVDI